MRRWTRVTSTRSVNTSSCLRPAATCRRRSPPRRSRSADSRRGLPRCGQLPDQTAEMRMGDAAEGRMGQGRTAHFVFTPEEPVRPPSPHGTGARTPRNRTPPRPGRRPSAIIHWSRSSADRCQRPCRPSGRTPAETRGRHVGRPRRGRDVGRSPGDRGAPRDVAQAREAAPTHQAGQMVAAKVTATDPMRSPGRR